MTKLEQVAAAIAACTIAGGVEMARAAIEAMREPSEAMAEAAFQLGPDRSAAAYWQAMIDAALAVHYVPGN